MRKGRNAFIDQPETETDLESRCRKYAKRFGFDLIKQTAEKGIPDRILVGLPIAPKMVWIEFKRPGSDNSLDPAQVEYHKKLRKLGYKPHTINDYDVFRALVDKLVRKYEKRQRKIRQKSN